MKYLFGLFLLLYAMTTSGQISFPAGFRLVKGSNPVGEDDMYTNGKYFFQTHLIFRSYDEYTWNDDKFKDYVRGAFGFSFYRTKDSLLWGTGKVKGSYSYVVVDWDGEAFELSSSYNDTGFSYYSKWLLSSIREYRKSGKWFIFPRRMPNAGHATPTRHMTSELAIDTILRLPEIKEDDAYIRRTTKGKRHLSGMIYGEPDSLHPYYWVVIGEDNGTSFVTHFTFYVYANGRKILYHDNFSDSTIDLGNWRRKYHRK